MGTSNHDVPQALAVDSQNNIYVTGYTYGGIDNYQNSGDTDIFLIKFNPSGEKIWSRQLGTNSFDIAEALSIDSENNILVSGYTRGGLEHNTNFGERDIFLLKYNSEGVLQTGDISIIDNQPPKISLVSSTNPDGKYKVGDNLSITVAFDERVVVKDIESKKLWAKYPETLSKEEILAVTNDSFDNIYITGITNGSMDGNSNSGSIDLFLIKYNSTGTKLWTKQWGSPSFEFANSISSDSFGNVYVSGYTGGNLDGNSNLGSSDVFLVKYNSSGTKLWTKQWGTTSSDTAHGITTDSLGNIYITGHTNGTLEGNDNEGGYDIFISKFNALGTKIWTKQLGSSSDDYAYGITSDLSGYVYVVGWTKGGGVDGNMNKGIRDYFLVKYNSLGTKIWTLQGGTSKNDEAYSVSTDLLGNVYITGNTSSTLSGETNNGGLNNGNHDLFIEKYDSTGTKQWTKQWGGGNGEQGKSIITDKFGNVYVAGNIGGGSNWDIFLMKYNSEGTKQWTKQWGTNLNDLAYGISTDSFGNIYVAGSTKGHTTGSHLFGTEDIILIKYSPEIPTLQLETGDIDHHAFYSSGNNTNTLTFNYTVQPSDNTSDLNYTSSNALSLNSGSITDLALNNADLTLPALDSSASLGGSKNIVVDGVDGIRPTVVSTSPADNSSSVSLSNNISITFSEEMDTTTITTNTSNTSCSGSIQVSSDNFSTCVQMSSSPSNSNSGKTFTVNPSSDLSYSTTYKIRVTTSSKDSTAKALSSQWTTSTGFTTITWAGTQQLGTSSHDYAYGVATDSLGNIYVTGYTFGGLDGNISAGNRDLFLVKYNSFGTKQWTKQLGTSSSDYAYGVATDSSGNVYVTGMTPGGLDGN